MPEKAGKRKRYSATWPSDEMRAGAKPGLDGYIILIGTEER